MDIAHAALGAAVAVALVMGWAGRRRLRRAQTDTSEAIAVAADELGRRPDSVSDAIAALAEQRNASEARLALIETTMARSTAGLMALDADLEIIFATDTARRLLRGRHAAAAAGVRVRALAGRSLTSRQPQEQQIELLEENRVIRVRVDPLPEESGGVTVLVSDISDELRVDAMLQDFVANVSHELKTPVGALAVLAEALEQATDDEMRRRLASQLRIEARRVGDLVDDVLELSLVESDHTAMVPVDLADVIAEATRRVDVVAASSSSTVAVDLPGTPVVVSGDRLQLVSAVTNLLDNAIKYSSLQDELPTEVRVRLERSSHRAMLEVVDHGIGIPESHRGRIFERFYRVDAARSRDRGGTGIGLAIVRHVAMNHGGEIEVESRLGVGSTFRLWLPLERR